MSHALPATWSRNHRQDDAGLPIPPCHPSILRLGRTCRWPAPATVPSAVWTPARLTQRLLLPLHFADGRQYFVTVLAGRNPAVSGTSEPWLKGVVVENGTSASANRRMAPTGDPALSRPHERRPF
jgi:hypothetical protein